VAEKGNHEDNPNVDKQRDSQYITLPGDKDLPPMAMGDEDLHHMIDWFECLRSRQQPHATVRNGFAHSVACIMSRKPTGRASGCITIRCRKRFSTTRPRREERATANGRGAPLRCCRSGGPKGKP
jgi:hypothetical protein